MLYRSFLVSLLILSFLECSLYTVWEVFKEEFKYLVNSFTHVYLKERSGSTLSCKLPVNIW